MNRAKRFLLLAISLCIFMSLAAPAQAKLGDETVPIDDDARWDDGFGFSTVNQLPFVVVRAIAVNSSGLYVGGSTMFFFGLPVINGIARWDGNNWSDVGGGVELCPSICYGAVYALEAKGDDIYAGGAFTSIDGVKANGIARYDGTKWHALGSGVDGRVQAIAFKDNEVYVGGLFTTAGGKTAYNFARWVGPAVVAPPPPPPVLLPRITGVEINRKKLTVAGERFEQGASILLNGESQKTKNDDQNPQTLLIAKKSGKKARPGVRLQVENPDGKLSPEFIISQ
ncbi:MAG: hypothetical protein WBV94_19195 [Blastocatellia bacterium]